MPSLDGFKDTKYGAYYQLDWDTSKASPGVTTISWTLYAKGRENASGWTKLENYIKVTMGSTVLYERDTTTDGSSDEQWTKFDGRVRDSGSFNIEHTAETKLTVTITGWIYDHTVYETTGEATIPSNYAPSIDINWTERGVLYYSGCDVATFSGWYDSTSESYISNGSTFSDATDLNVKCWPSRYYQLVATVNDPNAWVCSNSPITGSVASDSDATSSVYFEFWSKYTVKYDANGGTGSTESSSHQYGTPEQLTVNGFSKTGYTFAGWNTKRDGTGDSYLNEQSVENLTATAGGTVTLYAQWLADSTKLSFNANGGTNTPGANFALIDPPTGYGATVSWVTVTYGTSNFSNMNGNIPTRPGYKFLGWYTSATGGTQIYDASGESTDNGTYWNSSSQWISTSDRTVYAHWEVMSQTHIDTDDEFSLVQPQVFTNGSWHAAQTHRCRNGSWEFS